MEQLDMEKLDKALIYVSRIADGKNPVNNLPAEEDAVMNDPNVIRCMFFIKEALTAIRNNGGVVGRSARPQKKAFPLDSLSTYEYEGNKTITAFVEQLNHGINTDEYQKLKYKIITDWLKENGFLQEVNDDKLGKKTTISTAKGQSVGITHSLQTSMSGVSYNRVEYDKSGQEFIIRELPGIMSNDK